MAASPLSALTAISSIDGRYRNKCEELSQYFSEYALIKYRTLVEIRWLQKLAENPDIAEVEPFSAEENAYLESLVNDFFFR